MLRGKSLLDYTSIISSNKYKKNNETLVVSIICDKFGCNDGKLFTEEESIHKLQIPGKINIRDYKYCIKCIYNYFKEKI